MPARVATPTNASSPAVAASMRGNRSKDTVPEILVQRELCKLGIRGYRKDAKTLPGRPDIAFTKHKVAIFVNGCFQ
jgi:DNA mismatch endonuclease (patch repair protein)